MEAVSMFQAKADPKPGTLFISPTGAEGVILEGKRDGKPVARLTCTFEKEGVKCQNTHERLSSDWHQCGRCPEHAKSKGAKGPGGLKVAAGNDPELAALLEQAEKVKAAIKAKAAAEREAKKPAKNPEAMRERQLKQARERLERALKLAAEKGVEVSPTTIQEAEEAIEA